MRLLVLAATGLLLGAVPAQADDRPPTPAERTAIESALKAGGFVSWDDIELDDGRWEVDDARHSDGHEYDVKLAPQTYEIIRKSRD